MLQSHRRLGRAVLEHLSRRREWYWAPLLYALAFVFLYRQIFFPEKGPVGFGWDTIEAYWADLAYFAHQLGELDWPLWNPYEKGGNPYFAIPERGPTYPLNWLFGAYGAAAGETSWWLMQLKQFTHHVIAALCMHAFLRSRKLPPLAAIVGGLAWMGSAPMLIHKASAILWPMVWVPLIWIAIDRCVEKPGWRRGVLLGGAIALSGAAGSAPGFFYALLMALPYGVWRGGAALYRHVRAPEQRTYPLTLAASIAAGLVVTLCLLWITYAATAELTSLSQRADRSAAYALSFPLQLGPMLRGMVSPLAGKSDSYLGIATMLLALFALSRPRFDRGVAIPMLLCAAFYTLLAVGEGTPLLPYLVEHAPGFDLFRASNRYKLVATPFLCALAGYGVAALLAVPDEPRRRITRLLILAALSAAFVGMCLWWPVLRKHPDLPGLSHSILLIVLTLGCGVAAAIAPPRFRPLAAAAIAAAVLYDPQRFVHARGAALEPAMDNLEDRKWLADLADVHVDWRIYDEFVLEQRAGSRLAIREFRGYPAGGSLEYRRYDDILKVARQKPEILAAFNIRYLFYGAHHRAGHRPKHVRKPPFELAPKHWKRLRPHVHEALHPAPRVSWYGAARFVDSPGPSALLQVLAAEDESGVRRWVVLEEGAWRQIWTRTLARMAGEDAGPTRPQWATLAYQPDARSAIGDERAAALQARLERPPTPVAGEIAHASANRLVTVIDAPEAGVVVVNDALYPGWKARIDGEPAPVFFANTFARAVYVESGRHTIEWRFRPRGHGARLAAFWVGILALILAVIPPRKRYR